MAGPIPPPAAADRETANSLRPTRADGRLGVMESPDPRPGAPLRIRRGLPADLPAIVRRWRELVAEHAAFAPDLYALAPHADATYAATVRGQMTDRESLVLVVEGVGDIDAYLTGGLGLRAPVYAVREIGMIFDLAVRPERRREGLGAALLAEAGRHFAARGVERLQVDFNPENGAARGFWTRNGFETLCVEAYRRP
jgi:ribosomal-protein-alanine N-acetyltransferase